jgi:uncharacterized zinc-type alcohol dehydrogenase-like protein
MHPTKGYAAHSKTSPLALFSFERRDPGPVRRDWSGTTYPCVPGREIVGRVVKVGRDVKYRFVIDLAMLN